MLSPTLFGIYVNDILVLLQTHQHGCLVFGRFVGLLMYADDLVLLSITQGDLRSLFGIELVRHEAEYEKVSHVKNKS